MALQSKMQTKPSLFQILLVFTLFVVQKAEHFAKCTKGFTAENVSVAFSGRSALDCFQMCSRQTWCTGVNVCPEFTRKGIRCSPCREMKSQGCENMALASSPVCYHAYKKSHILQTEVTTPLATSFSSAEEIPSTAPETTATADLLTLPPTHELLSEAGATFDLTSEEKTAEPNTVAQTSQANLGDEPNETDATTQFISFLTSEKTTKAESNSFQQTSTIVSNEDRDQSELTESGTSLQTFKSTTGGITVKTTQADQTSPTTTEEETTQSQATTQITTSLSEESETSLQTLVTDTNNPTMKTTQADQTSPTTTEVEPTQNEMSTQTTTSLPTESETSLQTLVSTTDNPTLKTTQADQTSPTTTEVEPTQNEMSTQTTTSLPTESETYLQTLVSTTDNPTLKTTQADRTSPATTEVEPTQSQPITQTTTSLKTSGITTHIPTTSAIFGQDGTTFMTTESVSLTTSFVCENGGTPNGVKCRCTIRYGGNTCERYIRDCTEAYENGYQSTTYNGAFKIQPISSPAPFNVLCSFTAGGRTLPLRRLKTSYFDKSWNTCKVGFGDNLFANPTSYKFFIGLENLHHITKQASYTFVMYIQYYNYGKREGFAIYHNFTIGPESESYALTYDRFDTAASTIDNGFSTARPVRFAARGKYHNGCHTWGGVAGWFGMDCGHYSVFFDGSFYWTMNGPGSYRYDVEMLEFRLVRTSGFYGG